MPESVAVITTPLLHHCQIRNLKLALLNSRYVIFEEYLKLFILCKQFGYEKGFLRRILDQF